jgi:bifunctional DNA-binding transcriptional regulator/antitoxin component of YhaV-PrlF toxin-antitoxin module
MVAQEAAMAKKRNEPKVAEAKLAYRADSQPLYPVFGTTKLSSKNQITLPVAYVRDLGLQPGDEIIIWLEKGHMVLEKRLHGKELLDSLQGSMKDPEWKTKEDIDAWIRSLREEWNGD